MFYYILEPWDYYIVFKIFFELNFEFSNINQKYHVVYRKVQITLEICKIKFICRIFSISICENQLIFVLILKSLMFSYNLMFNDYCGMFKKFSNLSSNFRTFSKNAILYIRNINNIEIWQNKIYFFNIFNFDVRK